MTETRLMNGRDGALRRPDIAARCPYHIRRDRSGGHSSYKIALMRFLFFAITIFAGVLICSGDASAQTLLNQTPPQSNTSSSGSRPQPAQTAPPTKTAPSKTQTAKTETRTSQSQFHQAKKEHGHGYSHGGGGVGVGVGATIDLGGIGQRRPEADPFAVPAGPQPVTARTEEKPSPVKKPREVAKPDPFAGVQLTGPQAKGESNR